MLPLLLIQSEDGRPEPDPEPGGRRAGAVLAGALSWLYPWPAILAWLFVAALLFDGLIGALAAVSTLMLAFWRLSRCYPDSGLNSHQQ